MSSEESQNMSQVARGAKVLMPATLIGTILVLAHDMLINGLISTEEYGLYATCKRVLQVGFLLIFLGLENAVIHFVSKGRATGNRRAEAGAWQGAQLATLVAGVVLAAVLFVWAEPIGSLFQKDAGEALPWALRVLAIALPLAALRMMTTSASQGLLVMWPKAIILQVLWPLINLIGVALFVWVLGQGLAGVLWAYDLSMAVGALLGLYILLRHRPDFFRKGESGTLPFKALAAFSFPLWIYTLVNAAYAWGDQLMLAKLAGLEAAGIYAPVATLAPLFGIGLTALSGIFAPMISGLHATGDKEGLRALYKTVSRWALTLALPICAGALVVPEAVVGVWPAGRPEAAPALQILALANIPGVAVGSVNYMLIMSGHQRHVLWNGIPGVFVNLALGFWLIPKYGLTGAAIANGGALVFISVVAACQVWWLLGAQPISLKMYKPLVAILPAGFAGYHAGQLFELAPLVTVAFVGLVIAVVFTVAMLLLGIEPGDRDVLRARRGR